MDDGEIVSLYRDGEQIPRSEYSRYERKFRREYREVHRELEDAREELDDLGFDELFNGPGIKVVEWSGLLTDLNDSGLHIAFSYGDRETERELKLTPYGQLGARLVNQLIAGEKEDNHDED